MSSVVLQLYEIVLLLFAWFDSIGQSITVFVDEVRLMKPLIAIEKDHRNAKEREKSKVAMLCQPRNRDFGRLVTIRARFLGTLVGCRSAPINVVNVPIGRASTFGTITTLSRRSRSPLAIQARVVAREDHFFLDGNSNLEKKKDGMTHTLVFIPKRKSFDSIGHSVKSTRYIAQNRKNRISEHFLSKEIKKREKWAGIRRTILGMIFLQKTKKRQPWWRRRQLPQVRTTTLSQ